MTTEQTIEGHQTGRTHGVTEETRVAIRHCLDAIAKATDLVL